MPSLQYYNTQYVNLSNLFNNSDKDGSLTKCIKKLFFRQTKCRSSIMLFLKGNITYKDVSKTKLQIQNCTHSCITHLGCSLYTDSSFTIIMSIKNG